MNWEAIGAVGEVVGAIGVIVTLVYLARQVRIGNRLARAEAYRSPNSDLNALNGAFSTDPVFRKAFRRALEGATRDELDPDERTSLDGFLISITNIYEQLAREAREGIPDSDSISFAGRGTFSLPYYQTSWSFYKQYLSSAFVEEFEKSDIVEAWSETSFSGSES
jgi:hypothetical protein